MQVQEAQPPAEGGLGGGEKPLLGRRASDGKTSRLQQRRAPTLFLADVEAFEALRFEDV